VKRKINTSKDDNKERPSGLRGVVQLVMSQRSLFIVVACALLMVVITYVLYSFTQNILKERLQDRLIAIASTSASQFLEVDVQDINSIRGVEDLESPAVERIIEKLNRIRDANNNIQYAYIMRRTNDPLVVEFVADADSLTPEDELDVNENGVIEDDEWVPLPGDPYEIEEYPVLRDEAFFHPSVDRELQPDQWGMIMAAYAPIIDSAGDTVAIVGIDVLVDDFREKTQVTLLPFILFVLFLVVLLMLLTLLLARVWEERVEMMREIDRQKDELLSIVSHQLATPVSSMKWYVEMMLDGDIGKLTNEQEKHLSSVQSVTADLSDLVGMILDVSRIQLGRMKVDRAPLDLNKFFKEVMEVIDPKAAEKGVKFTKKIPEKLPTAMLDKRLMRMTLENLLSNAIKYTPARGDVELTVEVSGNKLHYSVRDTGCGIPKSEHDQVFSKLYRGSNVKESEGNGFGLYVAKGGVESQGGKISFTSSEGKGTTFRVEMPLPPVEKRKEK